MSDDQLADLSPVKRALLEMREMRARMEDLERVRTEPVAIVGVGLRLPGGVATVDDYWRLLVSGTDAIREIPASRWDADFYHDPDPDAPGKIVSRFGGFVDRIDEFDAAFFGITPREAVSMDPQQRLLLEVAWEALEHAGQAPDQLAGSSAGVFVGLSSNDYLTTELKFTEAGDIDPYLATGGHPSVASGRVSYVLGLQGPSLTIDTACSSSLTAVHLAVQSLRLGECPLALAGGVSLMLLPELSINFSRAHMLAPDGRCKTFDARADGYVRSEGCALVVLKRLSDAVKDGDRILAVINGTAVNQDGRSSGLTVPNGPAQEAVIREALRRAKVTPDQVDYVEAHGTGTALGDPVELRALGGVFAAGRGDRNRLLVGSVKTNLGHLEAAAGVAAIIKVALALDHGVIPPHLHFETPTPHVDWDALALKVPSTATDWVRARHPRVAGVSAFGFSGTNAHVVLSEAPALAPSVPSVARPAHVLAISAKSDEALRAMAGRLSAFAAAHPTRLADLCHTMNTGRAHLSERAAILACSPEATRTALESLAATGTAAGVARGSVRGVRRPEVAFLFSGQGYEQPGMGRALFETQPVFRRALERCDEILRPHLDVPLVSLLYGTGDTRLHEPCYTQPVLFAFSFALAELWRSWGVEPAFVAGHSLGEDIAACVAGVFSVEQGLEMVAARARVMHSSLPEGAMAAVFAPVGDVETILRRAAIPVSVAAINGPQHVVISGTPPAIMAAVHACEQASLKVRAVAVPRACHSAAMDPVLGDIESLARGMTLVAPRLAIASTLTGRLASPHELTDPVYWRRHVRETVRFSDALQSLYDAGARVFVEIGPNGSLVSMGRRMFQSNDVAWLASLKHDGRDWDHILTTLGELYVRGVAIDWRAFDAACGHVKLHAPTYPFQRQRYWSDAVRPRRGGESRRAWSIRGERLVSPALSGVVYQTTLGVDQWPPLGDHRVDGEVRVPAAVFLECALAADECRLGLADFRIERGLTLDTQPRTAQLVIDPTGKCFSIVSASTEEPAPVWSTHATGNFLAETGDAPTPRDLDAIGARCTDEQTGEAFYAALAARRLQMGPAFRVIESVRSREGESLAEIQAPQPDGTWRVHPAVLDACLQAVAATLPAALRSTPYLFVGLGRMAIHGVARDRVFSHVQLELSNVMAGTLSARVALLSSAGEVLAELTDVTFQQAHDDAATFSSPWLYELGWRAQSLKDNRQPTEAIGQCLGTAIAASVPTLVVEHQLDAYARALGSVDAMAVAYVADALRQLGVAQLAAAPFTLSELVDRTGVQPRYARLMERFLEMLANAGGAARQGERWTLTRDLPRADAAVAFRQAVEQFGGVLPELTITEACARELTGVLRGDVDPLHLLFPGGSSEMAERVYQDSPAARTFNGCIRAGVASIVAELPTNRRLRVLEIGAGTGATTSSLLPLLPADRTRYVFSDLSPSFVAQAEEKFAEHSFLEYRVLDLERDALTQGFAAQEFDLIIAVNVLHATADLRGSLRQLRQLLAPGGMVLISEATEARPWLEVTFGLTDGWWRSHDHDLRPGHPLLTRAQWTGLLESAGFDSIEAHPQAEHRVFTTQGVFSARSTLSAATTPAPWLVFADRSGFADAIAAHLRRRGRDCILIPASVELSDSVQVGQLIARGVGEDAAVIAGVLYLRALDFTSAGVSGQEMLVAAQYNCAGALHIAQALLRRPPATRMWIVTSNAVSTAGDDRPTQLAQSPLWGWARTFALEHPQAWGGLIDVSTDDSQRSAERVVSELLSGDGEDQIALRGETRLIARLAKRPAVGTTRIQIQREASYLITGGLGRLGSELAKWLIGQGATHLTLVSRRSLDADRHRAVDALRALGADVEVIAADVADGAAMQQVFDGFGRARPALRGVIHAASAAGAARITELDAPALNAMLSPKVAGTCVLADLAAGRSLDFFVLFSSTTGVLGSAFLSHYAAANAFLDAFAVARRATNFPVTAITWGAWENIEIASPEVRQVMARSGLRLMPVAAGLQSLGRLLRPDSATVMVVDADWATLKHTFEAQGRRPFLQEIAPAARPRTVTSGSDGMRRRLANARGHERRELLARHVLEETARALRIDARQLDPSQGLFDLGMDSLMSLDVRKRLESTLDLKLPTTLTFNYPTIDAIVGFLAGRLEIDQTAGEPAPPVRSPLSAVQPGPMTAWRERAAVTPPKALDDLSEDELADLLTVKLEGLP